jgi:uridine kinase
VDSYYIDLSHLHFEERARFNFDAPEAIDFNLLVGHLRILLDGGEMLIPTYHFDTHTRGPESEWIPCSITTGGGPRALVFIEGLHAFYPERLRAMFECRIFIDARREICLSRRLERDMRERGRPRMSILRQFEETVIPMYEKYIAPARQFADLVVDGEEPIEDSAQTVFDFLLRRLT